MAEEHASEIEELLAGLDDPDSSVRSSAAGALGALGPDGTSAIVPLYRACRDENMYVRGEALHSLWEIAGSFYKNRTSKAWSLLEEGIPVLIGRLDDPWWDVRASGMSLLEMIGAAAAAALPRLRESLVEEKPTLEEYPGSWGLETQIKILRESAAKAIGAIIEIPNI